MPWDPVQYEKFKRQREAPFEDLIRLIDPRPDLRVVDLGCGTGALTARLAALLPDSQVLGIDSSPAMLERARTEERDNLRFELGDIATVEGSWDLVFSNAALHWLEGHDTLIPRVFGLVAPGGQLAIQMPSNHRHPAHRLILEIAGEEPYRSALGGYARASPVLNIDAYAQILYDCGADNILVFEKVYPHVVPDADAIAEWTAGTTLVPYFERLDPEMSDAFMVEYRQRLRTLWPQSPVFYGFRRTFLVVSRQD